MRVSFRVPDAPPFVLCVICLPPPPLHSQEGFAGGALKHGPFALIEDGFPVFMIILNDTLASFMVKSANEVRSRGARVLVITDMTERQLGAHDQELLHSLQERPGDLIRIPSAGELTAMIAAIPMQLLAYELSLQRGNDPDHPRHLAKVVTV